jgi:crotonobetainyl-CoA:carnitine CoA-transferase CaiB-like acyl-CoA transferase
VTAPLDGIRVLDLSRIAAGPFATMLMADLGAEVIKVERPGLGDEVRGLGRPLPGLSSDKTDYYLALNKSKSSVAVDLGTPAGLDVIHQLAARCDVVLENFRPGVADRLGIGFDQLRGLRPGLVYTSITGFGSSGPWAQQPANDIMMQSITGLMAATGEVGGAPVRLGSSLCDYSTGVFALSGTLAALFRRDQHPEGQHVELNLFDCSVTMLPNLVPKAGQGQLSQRVGRLHPQIIGYGTYECGDGNYITVGAFSETFWRRLCTVLGRADWAEDPGMASNTARLDHRDEIEPVLAASFRSRTRDEWATLLDEADVPNAPVLDLVEAVASEQAQHNRTTVEIVDGPTSYTVTSTPIRSEQWSARVVTPPEAVGASTRDVLGDLLDVDDEKYADLSNAGAFGPPARSTADQHGQEQT